MMIGYVYRCRFVPWDCAAIFAIRKTLVHFFLAQEAKLKKQQIIGWSRHAEALSQLLLIVLSFALAECVVVAYLMYHS